MPSKLIWSLLSHRLLSFLLSELMVYPSAKVLPLLATWVASNLWKVRIIQSYREWRIFYINEQGKGRVKGMMTNDPPFQTAALTAGTGISGVWGSSRSPGRRSCWWTPASARRRACWSYQDLPAYFTDMFWCLTMSMIDNSIKYKIWEDDLGHDLVSLQVPVESLLWFTQQGGDIPD